METRAHHLLIGAFMILLTVGLFGFLIWVAKVDIDQEYKDYDIYFSESVMGLARTGDVLYNGVPVGNVKAITIDPDNPSRVKVTAKLRSEVPVKTDSVAVLSMQGITGVLVVLIEGGSAESALLEPGDDDQNPVIPSRTSPIQELFEGGPDLINSALKTMSRLNTLLSDENLNKVSGILSNTENLTQNISSESADFKGISAELKAALMEIKTTAASLNAFLGEKGKDEKLGVVAKVTIGSLLKSADDLMKNLNAMTSENRESIAAFTNNTLPEVSRLVIDMRRLSRALTDLSEKMERDPSGVVFGTSLPEYEPKK